MLFLSSAASIAALSFIVSSASAQDCSPVGLTVAGERPGASPTSNSSTVLSIAAFDDGSGPAVFFGGSIDGAGSQSGDGLAKWDGERFVEMPASPVGDVLTMMVHDDGTGPALYAGGVLGCARWDGTSWTSLATFTGAVRSFAVYDDGSGAALYMGGQFPGLALGIGGENLAKWDGAGWLTVGGVFIGATVEALEAYDDGTGEALYVGSVYPMSVDGVSLSGFAAWDGRQWSNLGDLQGVLDMEPFDDSVNGNGMQLAVSRGNFGATPKLYRWDGNAFSAMGRGAYNTPSCLEFVDFGDGPALYTSAVGLGTLVRWDGADWVAVPDAPPERIDDLLEVQEAGAPAVYCVGPFKTVSGLDTNFIARRDLQGWSALGDGLGRDVHCSVTFDDGTGEALYMGGEMLGVNGAELHNIARWDGMSLSGVGAGLDVAQVGSLAVFDDGGGAALYAGAQPLDGEASILWRWDGVDWIEVGDRVWDDKTQVRDMLVFDDGNGPALWCALGTTGFTALEAEFVLKWDGQSWTSFVTTQDFITQLAVRELEVYDSGSGPELVAAGSFGSVDGVAALRVARWNGSAWSPMAGGFPGANLTVQSLAAHDGSLYAGGNMAGRLQVWDGVSWGIVPNPGISQALYSYDDGQGARLFSGGSFGVKRWDGGAWSELPNNANGAVTSFTEFQERLFFGGRFEATSETGDAYLSSWGKPCDGPLPYCTASTSSSGCLASIGTSNSLEQPVSGAGDYQVTAVDVESQKTGLVFVGINDAAALPFLNGTLCMQPPIAKRGPVVFSGGVGTGNCSGSFTTTVNTGAVIPSGLDGGVGQSVWHQWWHRDPGAGQGSLGASLSNAIRLDYQ